MKQTITKTIQSTLDKYCKGTQLVLLTYVGDRAYGLPTNNACHNVRGVYFCPDDVLFQVSSKDGVLNGFFIIEDEENKVDVSVDFSLQSLPSFIENLMHNEIDALEVLCVDEKDILFINPLTEILLENSSVFLTKNLYQKALIQCANWQEQLEEGIKEREKDKICENMTHLVRMYFMTIEALNSGEMHTYTFQTTPLLKAIRKGKYVQEDGSINIRYHVLMDDLQNRLDDAYKSARVPEAVSRNVLDTLQKQMIQAFVAMRATVK